MVATIFSFYRFKTYSSELIFGATKRKMFFLQNNIEFIFYKKNKKLPRNFRGSLQKNFLSKD